MVEVKFKKGDKVTVMGDGGDSGHTFPAGTEVEIIRINTDDLEPFYDCCEKPTGDCWWVYEQDLELIVNKETKEAMKAMKDAVLTVAKGLAKANGKVTTLEIKTELRRDYPYYYWTQDVVSTYMSQLAGDGLFNFTDNGTFRTYTLLGSPVAAPMYTAGTTYTGTPASAKSVGILSGKVPVKATVPAKKRGRPRKTIPAIISQTDALGKCNYSQFESVTVTKKDGSIVNYPLAAIRAQKKSPYAYASRYRGRINSVTVGGITYFTS